MFCFWPLKEVGGGGEVRKQLWWRIFVLFSCFHPLWEWVERNWNTRELRAIFLFFYLFSFSFRRTSRKGGGGRRALAFHLVAGRRRLLFFSFLYYIYLWGKEEEEEEETKNKSRHLFNLGTLETKEIQEPLNYKKKKPSTPSPFLFFFAISSYFLWQPGEREETWKKKGGGRGSHFIQFLYPNCAIISSFFKLGVKRFFFYDTNPINYGDDGIFAPHLPALCWPAVILKPFFFLYFLGEKMGCVTLAGFFERNFFISYNT